MLAATVVGNTTMHHLFLGSSPAALAQSPYVPATRAALTVDAREVGLSIHPDGQVSVLPNIAGWVGADTVGVILATDLHRQDELSLAVDIGTNGEMAMGLARAAADLLYGGGAGLRGGAPELRHAGADGAIDWVEMDGDVAWRTIGGAAPRGVCGSGLVDLVAAMLRTGRHRAERHDAHRRGPGPLPARPALAAGWCAANAAANLCWCPPLQRPRAVPCE